MSALMERSNRSDDYLSLMLLTTGKSTNPSKQGPRCFFLVCSGLHKTWAPQTPVYEVVTRPLVYEVVTRPLNGREAGRFEVTGKRCDPYVTNKALGSLWKPQNSNIYRVRKFGSEENLWLDVSPGPAYSADSRYFRYVSQDLQSTTPAKQPPKNCKTSKAIDHNFSPDHVADSGPKGAQYSQRHCIFEIDVSGGVCGGAGQDTCDVCKRCL